MQQITKVNLKAIKPCDQIWDDMKTISGGRQCEMCNKKITDFRKKSLKEIAQAHVYSDKPVCGIYTEHQLRNEENPKTTEAHPWWSSIKSNYLSLASFLLTLSVSAQDSTINQKPKIEQGVVNKSNKDLENKSLNKSINYSLFGIVFEGDNKTPLEYANVVLKSNQNIIMGCTTNSNGEYKLDLSQSFDSLPNSFFIEVSFIGFATKKIVFNKKDFQTSGTKNAMELNLNIQLVETEVIAFSVLDIKKKSWFGTAWDSIKSVFSKRNKKHD